MEFPFDINHLFTERVSVLDQSLVAGRKFAARPDLQTHVETVIDDLGRASAKAQQLTAPVTSASKLQSQGHQLYLLKDGESNGGRGVVVGFLKVGYKKLFLLDQQGLHIEAEPLCVLDFYIAENLQRHGYGLELFDFMLKHKNLEPVLMAYDRPSPKFLSFLAKHYCLAQSVPQVNHFVVFDGFFVSRSGTPSSPLTAQGMYGFFGPSEKGSPKKAGRRDQTILFSGAGSGTSGAEEAPLAVCPSSFPQRSVSSQYSHSLSVGSSPTRPTGSSCQRQPVQPPHGHLTCPPTDLVCFPPSPRSQHLSCPPSVTANRERHLHTGAEDCGVQRNMSEHPATGSSASKRHVPEREKVRKTGGWSWSVGHNCYTAQWVKQKQQYRSTRPW
ncbi:unnamed protein product [Lampetra planeri]